ncbi:MAG: DNA-protecting protein DprA [Roseburia sp.]|nr:DNA-protecting protein DprA [Roseburia sp.]MCM1241757.1 DNA-protecting protein DprA [Roseburia sp.]
MRYDRIQEDDLLPYAHWLYTIPGIGSKTIYMLLSGGMTPYDVYHMSAGQIEERLAAWPKRHDAAQRIVNAKENAGTKNKMNNISNIKAAYEKLAEKQIHFTFYGHRTYPEKLAQIPDAPYGLFF